MLRARHILSLLLLLTTWGCAPGFSTQHISLRRTPPLPEHWTALELHDARALELALDSSGQPHVGLLDTVGAYIGHFDPERGWLFEALPLDTVWAAPRLAIEGDSTEHVFAVERDSSALIHLTRSSPDTPWVRARLGAARYFAVAQEPDGTPMVLMHDRDTTSVLVLRHHPERGWSDVHTLQAIGPGSAGWTAPSIAADQRGHIHATWVNEDGLYYASRSSDGTWSTPSRLLDGIEYGAAALGVEDTGRVWLGAWVERDGLVVLESDDGVSWSTTQLRGTPRARPRLFLQHEGGPALVFDDRGALVACPVDGSRCEKDAQLTPQSRGGLTGVHRLHPRQPGWIATRCGEGRCWLEPLSAQ